MVHSQGRHGQSKASLGKAMYGPLWSAGIGISRNQHRKCPNYKSLLVSTNSIRHLYGPGLAALT